jgi:hypothetical protein
VTAPIQSRVFECAAEIVGGQRKLCDRLKVSPLQLSLWLSNEQTAPLPVFLGAVDVILASERGFAAIFNSRTPALH